MSRYQKRNAAIFFSNFYHYALEEIFFVAHTMQDKPNLGKPVPLNSFVLHRSFDAAHFSDKLKANRRSFF